MTPSVGKDQRYVFAFVNRHNASSASQIVRQSYSYKFEEHIGHCQHDSF